MRLVRKVVKLSCLDISLNSVYITMQVRKILADSAIGNYMINKLIAFLFHFYHHSTLHELCVLTATQ